MTDEDPKIAALRAELEARYDRQSSFHGSGGRATRDSVIDGFLDFTSPLEGDTNFMYADSLGFVTTGIGNKIDNDSRGPDGMYASGSMDSYSQALSLPWLRPDGSRASQDEVISEWRLVKSSYPGVQSVADKGITQLRLSKTAVQDLVASKMLENEKYIVQDLPNFAVLPADGQMVIHGMAWAMGGGFLKGFPQFRAAVSANDWVTAKAQGNFRGEEAHRKVAHDLLFDNAIKSVAYHLNPETLWYPNAAPNAPPSTSGGIGTRIAAVLALIAAGGTAYAYRHEISDFATQTHEKWAAAKQLKGST